MKQTEGKPMREEKQELVQSPHNIFIQIENYFNIQYFWLINKTVNTENNHFSMFNLKFQIFF